MRSRSRLLLAATATVTVVAGIWACSSDSGTTPLPTFADDASTKDTGVAADVNVPDTSPPNDAGVDVTDSSVAPDTGGRVLNDCKESDFAANDLSDPDASRVVRFPRADGGLGYAPPCVRVAAGESVTWRGDFLVHPLTQFNGDPNSPIDYYDDGGGPDGSITIGFPEAGWYGYQCAVHAQMYGAIEVR